MNIFHLRIYPMDQLFLWQTQIQTIERSYFDKLLIYTPWYDFSNNSDAKNDFGKMFVTKKMVRWNHSYFIYALECFVDLSTGNDLHKRKHYCKCWELHCTQKLFLLVKCFKRKANANLAKYFFFILNASLSTFTSDTFMLVNKVTLQNFIG